MTVLAAGGSVLAACTPAAPAAPTAKPAAAPTTAPAKPTTATAASPAAKAAASPAAKTAASPAASPATKALENWDGVLAAARGEGTLTIYGPPGPNYRVVYGAEFQKKYPFIQVEFQGGSGSQQGPKLVAERQAGRYIPDVYIGGATTPLATLLPIGALDPVPPVLVLPEVTNPDNWLNDRLHYQDNDEQYLLAFVGNAGATELYYNTREISATEIAEIDEWGDLLDPKWKGKIASTDPRTVGTAVGSLADIAAVPKYGLDFVRKLYAPETGVTLTQDTRQIQDWLAQGQYPLAMGIEDFPDLQALGLPVAQKGLDAVTISAGFGNIAVVNRRPHPNAAKVFVNWLLSKEGQEIYQRETKAASLRTDIGRAGVPEREIPVDGREYVNTQQQRYTPLRQQIRALIGEIRS